MKSRLVDVFVPSIMKFISLVETTMNATPILLKVETDQPIGCTYSGEDIEVLRQYLQSDLFMKMVIEFDLQAQRYDYYVWDTEQGTPVSGTLLKDGFSLRWRPLSLTGFMDHLHWMLMTSTDFYKKRSLSADEGIGHIYDFAKHTIGLDRAFFEDVRNWKGFPGWIASDWTFYSINPDFLNSRNQAEPLFADHPTYFDGFLCDSAVYCYRGNVFYLLLTNGGA